MSNKLWEVHSNMSQRVDFSQIDPKLTTVAGDPSDFFESDGSLGMAAEAPKPKKEASKRIPPKRYHEAQKAARKFIAAEYPEMAAGAIPLFPASDKPYDSSSPKACYHALVFGLAKVELGVNPATLKWKQICKPYFETAMIPLTSGKNEKRHKRRIESGSHWPEVVRTFKKNFDLALPPKGALTGQEVLRRLKEKVLVPAFIAKLEATLEENTMNANISITLNNEIRVDGEAVHHSTWKGGRGGETGGFVLGAGDAKVTLTDAQLEKTFDFFRAVLVTAAAKK